jgi:hypothetical protein
MSGQDESHQGITAPGLSEADQNINNSTEDISNKASGHKANLSNPSKFLLFPFHLTLPFSSILDDEGSILLVIVKGK